MSTVVGAAPRSPDVPTQRTSRAPHGVRDPEGTSQTVAPVTEDVARTDLDAMDELDHNVLDWEIAACRTLTLGIASAMIMVLCLQPFIGWTLMAAELACCTIALVHVRMARFVLGRLDARRDRARLERMRWIAVTLESTFGTVALLVALRIKGAAWAAASPLVMVYLLGVVASSFRLRASLVLYAAALAILQWLVLFHGVIAPRLDPAVVDASPALQAWSAWERAFWIGMIGALLAVSTQRLRALALASTAQRQLRRHLVHELERLVSPDVASRVLAGRLEPGQSERRYVTVLFCDLRDFTALCERRRAEDALDVLNAFYERACVIIRAHGGHVNKFLGDGLLAIFGAPERHSHHARAALDAARQLVRASDELRREGGVWADLQVGIGLDTGDVVTGALGSPERLEYTAIGATVNRAARLQALSTSTGRGIVLSARTATELDDPDQLLPLGEAKIKGVDRPIRIYTPR